MKKSILSCISLLLLGIVIWWMSANVVWLGDDLDYKYMMKGEIWQSWGKIKTVKAFFESQWIHYRHVNGRFVAHTLVQLFNARLGQQGFAICNGIVYMLFTVLLAKAGNVLLKKNSAGILSAICLSVLCFITKMMPTCQIGYIWGMMANLAWLLLYFRRGRPSWLSTFAMLLAGIIVGNWQESISIGVCAGVGIWWIIQALESGKQDSLRFDWRRSWMLLGYVAGTASNCFAPSTMGRITDIDITFSDQMLIASYSFPAILLLLICVIYFRAKHDDIQLFSFRHSDGSIPEGVLTAALLTLVIFNGAIGIYSNRQLFGANLFAAILSLRILPGHRFNVFFNVLGSIAVVVYWTLMIQGINEVRQQYIDIAKLHSESADGSVYYDRTRVMTLGFPLRAKYYEDILGLFDNDLHHSLMKDFKHRRQGATLKIKPTVEIDGEKVERFAYGHFTVTLKQPPKGDPPRKIMVYGHYPVPWIKAKPRIIPVTKYFKRRPPYATAVIIPEFPFFTADSIQIIDN